MELNPSDVLTFSTGVFFMSNHTNTIGEESQSKTSSDICLKDVYSEKHHYPFKKPPLSSTGTKPPYVFFLTLCGWFDTTPRSIVCDFGSLCSSVTR